LIVKNTIGILYPPKYSPSTHKPIFFEALEIKNGAVLARRLEEGKEDVFLIRENLEFLVYYLNKDKFKDFFQKR